MFDRHNYNDLVKKYQKKLKTVGVHDILLKNIIQYSKTVKGKHNTSSKFDPETNLKLIALAQACQNSDDPRESLLVNSIIDYDNEKIQKVLLPFCSKAKVDKEIEDAIQLLRCQEVDRYFFPSSTNWYSSKKYAQEKCELLIPLLSQFLSLNDVLTPFYVISKIKVDFMIPVYDYCIDHNHLEPLIMLAEMLSNKYYFSSLFTLGESYEKKNKLTEAIIIYHHVIDLKQDHSYSASAAIERLLQSANRENLVKDIKSFLEKNHNNIVYVKKIKNLESVLDELLKLDITSTSSNEKLALALKIKARRNSFMAELYANNLQQEIQLSEKEKFIFKHIENMLRK